MSLIEEVARRTSHIQNNTNTMVWYHLVGDSALSMCAHDLSLNKVMYLHVSHNDDNIYVHESNTENRFGCVIAPTCENVSDDIKAKAVMSVVIRFLAQFPCIGLEVDE